MEKILNDNLERQICEKVRVFIRARPTAIGKINQLNNSSNDASPQDINEGLLEKIENEVKLQSLSNESCLSISPSGVCLYSSDTSSLPKKVIKGIDGTSSSQKIEKTFQFNGAFAIDCSQDNVYEIVAKPLVESVLLGYSATIIAYGATGSGKTYTMRGSDKKTERGLMPRCFENLVSKQADCEIWISYLQIYCEDVIDLLAINNTEKLTLRESDRGRVYVDGLSKFRVTTELEFEELLIRGDTNRSTAATNVNEMSSRSHAICIITLKKNSSEGMSTESSLVLVDLAGSERAEASEGRNYQRFEEAKAINLSLSALGNCISALADGKQHIPYRDSKLTRLLQSSLAGESRLSIIATVNPGSDENGEILSTLRFASRASRVTVAAKISRIVDYEKMYLLSLEKVEELNRELSKNNALLSETQLLVLSKDSELDEAKTRISELEVLLSNIKDRSMIISESASNTGNDVIAMMNKQHDADIQAIRAKHDAKVNELKENIREANAREAKLQLDIRDEKQKHLDTLRSLRNMQESFVKEEGESISRKEELLTELQSKQNEIDNLVEQLIALGSYAKRTTEELEASESKMSNMVSIAQVKDMESLFMETVTRLSERVKQLEIPKTPLRDETENTGSMPRAPYSIQQQYSGRAQDPLTRTARIEPGGRIRR